MEVYIQSIGVDRAQVTWTVPVFADNSGEEPNVTITHDPGLLVDSSYPIGTTEVTLQAQDASGNVLHCKFSVVVHGKSSSRPIPQLPADYLSAPSESGRT